MKITYIIILFIALISLQCNKPADHYPLSSDKLDSLYLKTNNTFRKKGDYEGLIKVNLNLVKQSKEIEYQKGAVRSYINIANLFWNLKKNKEALDLLNFVRPDIKKIDDPSIKAWFYTECMLNHYELGLYEKTDKFFQQSLSEADKIKDEKQKSSQKKFLYAFKASRFQVEEKEDSVFMYLKKAYKEGPDPIICARISRSFLMLGPQLDSSSYYLHQADSLYLTGNYPIYQKGILLRNRGLYFKTVKNMIRLLILI